MKVGDLVQFLFIPAHICKGDLSRCRCASEVMLALPARVTAVHPLGPDGVLELALDVPMGVFAIITASRQVLLEDGWTPPDAMAALAAAQATGEEIRWYGCPRDLGYASQQSCSPQATTSPPESGSWMRDASSSPLTA